MTITYHPNLIQGSDEWLMARCGLLTASEMKLAVYVPKPETRVKKDGTPYKQREFGPSDTDACRAHVYELAAQRVNRYVEPTYIGDEMLRGYDDELLARELYHKHYAPVQEMGFVTNDKWGFTLGGSPDGLVGDDGFIENKSRRQKFQFQTLVECVKESRVPDDYLLQVQTLFLVTERQWCDFISYSGGMHMVTIRVCPDPVVMAAIVEAAAAFEKRVDEKIADYTDVLATYGRLIPTERRITKEMFV